jgi:replicative DNA helicase
MLSISEVERRQSVCTIAEMLQEETDRLHRRATDQAPLTGTTSGFAALDDVTGGFQPGNLIILAARPSMGKSALVANFAENAAIAGHPTLMFSLEMSKSELSQRFIASQASIPGDDLRRGRISDQRWPRLLKAAGTFAKVPLFVDDSSDVSVLDVRAKARRIHHQLADQGGLGLIIVDYLQLMRPDGRADNRVEQVGQISRGLKSLARELKVPVIALSQLSRNVEQRGGEKRPILSDLRESGSLEQDSDLVMFIYREAYYDRDSQRPDAADILIAKHRNGPVGEVELTFESQYPRFKNRMAEDYGRP